MGIYVLVHVFLFLHLFLWTTSGISWLALSRMTSVETVLTKKDCENLTGIVKPQVQVCKRNLSMMKSVRIGSIIALEECQWQFRSRRWSCQIPHGMEVFESALGKGTREAAFVHAISSAGVAHAVTRACSSGLLDHCGCDGSVRGKSPQGFEWAGCSDNVAYGAAFSKTFSDGKERVRGTGSDRALMNLHNNEAGRRAIKNNLKVQCKCHGVSGSCELKTCWRAMPSFREVGDILKEKFDGATEVRLERKHSRKMLVPTTRYVKRHREEDLVYLHKSADFCTENLKIGSIGTHGRYCNKTSKAIDGCDLMCCGRSYKTEKKTVFERCNCKFYWCCDVKCSQCKRVVEEHVCL